MKFFSKSKILFTIFLIFILCFTFGCTELSTSPHTMQIFALDTVIDITAYGDNSKEAVNKASAEIYRLEKLFSVTNVTSEIYKLNTSDGKEVKLSEETYTLLKFSKDISHIAEGNFDITIYPVMKLWGFTQKEYRVPSESEINQVLSSVDSDNLVLHNNNTAKLLNNAQVDLGGIAKGYIADKAAQAMKDAGCNSGLISLGGNVCTIGEKNSEKSWNIGIMHPDSNTYFATIDVEECSVITSGAYQRNFTENGITYHHILDPETGKPSDSDALSVTVIGKDGAFCDALSTAIFIGGSEFAENLREKSSDFEYIILTEKNEVVASKNLEGKLNISEDFSDIKVVFK